MLQPSKPWPLAVRGLVLLLVLGAVYVALIADVSYGVRWLARVFGPCLGAAVVLHWYRCQ